MVTMPLFSDGPFCRVAFVYTRDGFRTLCMRGAPIEPPRTLVPVISELRAWVDTDLIRRIAA